MKGLPGSTAAAARTLARPAATFTIAAMSELLGWRLARRWRKGRTTILPRSRGRLQDWRQDIPAAFLYFFEFIDHAVDSLAGELGYVRRRGPTFRRLKRLLESSHVIPVQLGYKVIGFAATNRSHITADRVPPKTLELLGQGNVNLAIMTIELLRVRWRVVKHKESNHGINSTSLHLVEAPSSR